LPSDVVHLEFLTQAPEPVLAVNDRDRSAFAGAANLVDLAATCYETPVLLNSSGKSRA
jgi:hypothetical protein